MDSTVSEPIVGSTAEEWLRARLAAPGITATAKASLTTLLHGVGAENMNADQVFLSVVMRTQVKRWEQLQDALLCLAAQTNSNFEVLLMLHKVSDSDAERVDALISGYPSSFANRVRVLRVTGGGRSRPLNESIEEASGSYIAFFDDDDLLMANWVEAFHDGATEAPGQLIRVNVATQHNSVEAWSDGSAGQRTTSVVRAEYARTFNFIDNFERNHTPFMGFAFPRAFFSFWGERFDEKLAVCEDWDIAMRAAQLVGVKSSDELTAVYRQWSDAQTSYTSHAQEEWLQAEQRVREKIVSVPFLAPSHLVADFMTVVKRFRENEQLMFQHHSNLVTSTTWRIMEPLRASMRFARKFTRR